MEDPLAAQCDRDRNPLHEEQRAIVPRPGEARALNTVSDDRRRLVFANCGEIVESHIAAVAFARAYTEAPVGRRRATVVTSAAGAPLGRTHTARPSRAW
jgi:nickel-dependent lactate racemase